MLRLDSGDDGLQADSDGTAVWVDTIRPEPTHSKVFRHSSCVVNLLDCIGTQRFDDAVARVLNSIFKQVQFASYEIHNGKFTRIGGGLAESRAMSSKSELTSLLREQDGARAEPSVTAMGRVVGVRGWNGPSEFWLIIEAAAGSSMPADELEILESRSGLLITAHAKHVELQHARQSAIRALGSVARIEECLTASGALPIREVEVCSRIIYGLSTLGIAVDLCLSEETVRTYRKRAYQRLSLGTERQLLSWYLRQWTNWQAGSAPA
jgi:DNA-binding CsgD family transcriptional regulator